MFNIEKNLCEKLFQIYDLLKPFQHNHNSLLVPNNLN